MKSPKIRPLWVRFFYFSLIPTQT
ncbi:hypothetical protein BDI4_580069 [Burkholderia diffusa]|nr:hypothetical protein BDI4_580069 [Burkholderia diffusa]